MPVGCLPRRLNTPGVSLVKFISADKLRQNTTFYTSLHALNLFLCVSMKIGVSFTADSFSLDPNIPSEMYVFRPIPSTLPRRYTSTIALLPIHPIHIPWFVVLLL